MRQLEFTAQLSRLELMEVLRDTENTILDLVVSVAPADFNARVEDAISTRAWEALQEEVAAMGTVPSWQIDEALRAFREIARRLFPDKKHLNCCEKSRSS